MEPPIFLSYLFHGWLFEFHVDHIEAVNPANHDRYRIVLDPYTPVPFLITLLENGSIQ